MTENKKLEIHEGRSRLTIGISNFNPAVINDAFLIETGFIDSLDIVNKDAFHMSNMGSHINLLDNCKTQIESSFREISIATCETNKIIDFFEILKSSFPYINVEKMLYMSVDHIKAPNIKKEFFSSLINTTLMNPTYLEFDLEDYNFTLYECAKDKLHLSKSLNSNYDGGQPITQIDGLKEKYEALDTFFTKFYKNDLGIVKLSK